MARASQRRPTPTPPTPPAASEAPPDNGRATIAHLADEVLPMLIARLGASGLGELEVRQDGWRVRLRRADPAAGEQPPASAVPAPGARTPPIPRSHERREPAGSDSADASRRERGRVAITSPGVGYYQPVE
ncbi:MAG TPA: hypothetical protein VH741_01025, partial [Candidatus Limnocylindrales bacterium]